MKILLVRPAVGTRYMTTFYKLIEIEPLALEYVGAAVSGYDVRILDMILEDGFDGLKNTLREFRPDIVWTTGWTVEASACKRVHASAKVFDRSILTVAVGIHATVATDDFLDSHIDIVVIGEGALAFREIVEHVERGQDFKDIKRIAVRCRDTLHRTLPRLPCYLDDMPFPNRSLTARLRHKYHFGVWSSDVAKASRVCWSKPRLPWSMLPIM